MNFFKELLDAGSQPEELVDGIARELSLKTTIMTTLLDSIPDHIFVKDLNLNYTYCNKSVLEFFGCRYEDIIGKNDYNNDSLGFSKELADLFTEQDLEIINGGENRISEAVIKNAKGLPKHYELIKLPLVLDGDTVGVVGISRDINKRKEAEILTAAKLEYTKKLNDVLSLITKLSSIFEGDFKMAADFITKIGCQALNVHGLGIWNYDKDNLTLKPVSYYNASAGEHVSQGDIDLKSRHEYTALMREKRIIAFRNVEECRVINHYTDELTLCASLGAPVRMDGKIVSIVCAEQLCRKTHPESRDWLVEEQNFVSSLADLAAIAISGEERRKAREDAEIANRAKSSFLANMSHEIRTPMNAIIGITEILMQEERLSNGVVEGLEQIYNSCNMLLSIINEILDFSKIEAGKLDIVPSRYEIASTINDTISLNVMRVEDRLIDFKLEIDENIPAVLIGDELRIKQILNNFLSNAFKYTEAGSVTFSVSAEPIAGDDGKVMLVLSVKDTGCGLTDEQQKKLFDEYVRFENALSSGIQGTGLGLAIASRLVELMDGEIQVESTVNEGSVFTARLPQETVGSGVLGKDLARSLQSLDINSTPHKRKGHFERDLMPYGKVLVVDDVETNLYVAKGLMRFYRLQIDTAMSGREAIEKIKQGHVYDVIFMDHMMPNMDGTRAMQNLRELGYTHPIVVLTANAVSGQAEIFLKSGFDEFISKPIDIRQLNEVLNKFVRDKQPPEVLEAARAQSAGVQAASSESNESAEDHITAELLSGKEIDGLDIGRGLERYGGNGEIYLKILQSYLHSMRSMIEPIEAFDQANLIDYKIKVHGVSGASFDIFAADIGTEAKALEKAAVNGDVDYINTNNVPFVSALRRLLDDVDNLLASIEAEKPKMDASTKYEPDAALIETLINACKVYDMSTVDNVVAEIEKYQYESDPELAGWLRENADAMNFTQIIDKLSKD